MIKSNENSKIIMLHSSSVLAKEILAPESKNYIILQLEDSNSESYDLMAEIIEKDKNV